MSANSGAGDDSANGTSESKQSPSTPDEFVEWLVQRRSELRERRERPIGTSGILTMAVGKPRDAPGPSTVDVNLHPPSAEYEVMVRFLDLVESLCPTRLALEFHAEWPRGKLVFVRDLILAMKSLEETLRYDASSASGVTDGQHAKPCDPMSGIRQLPVPVVKHSGLKAEFDWSNARGASTSFLGLRLDEARHIVSREGFAPLNLAKSPLRFALLARLVRNRDTPTSRETLAQAWEEHGTDHSPSDGRIDSEISQLRREILVMGLEIRNFRKLGWLLQENPLPKL